ncbi:MAG: tetratricopeptide repeat protein [Asticcacaulis sp.]|uniref:tetratricopeptide repeat protein n=1 Tax=Asticcacaulis sp. TaxID=1872648 RepID=UPI0039E6F199
MKKSAISLLAASLIASATSVSAQPLLRAESPHLVVYSSYNDAITTSYVSQLEKLRYTLDAFYGDHDTANAEQKLTIYLIDVLNYPALLERIRATQYVGAFNLTECASGLSVRSTLNRDIVKVNGPIEHPTNVPHYLMPLNSGYARLYLANSSDRVFPRWLDSGFGTYYSTLLTDGQQVSIGTIPRDNVYGMGALKQFGDYLTNGSWPDFDDIIKDGKDIFNQQQKSRGVGLVDVNSSDGTTQIVNNRIYYAKSWALTYYVLSKPDSMQQLFNYLDLTDGGTQAPDAFSQTYGVKVTTMGRTYSSDKPQSDNLVFKDMAEPPITLSPMPQSAEKLMYLAAAMDACPAPSEQAPVVKAILREAAKYPNDSYAQNLAASALIASGQAEQAIPALRTIIAASPDDAQAYLRLGQALFDMAEHGKTEDGITASAQLDAARAALMRSYKLSPANAEALYSLSRALAYGAANAPEPAIQAGIEAARLQPTVPQYAGNAAILLLAAGRRDEARTLLIPVANGPATFNNDSAKTLSFPEWARAIIKALDSGEAPEKLSALLKDIPSGD